MGAGRSLILRPARAKPHWARRHAPDRRPWQDRPLGDVVAGMRLAPIIEVAARALVVDRAVCWS
jgi:hypothetical protein